jgi:glycosyltransferase involved in cell wall biosynthesis
MTMKNTELKVSAPLVVGLPVYNEKRHIEETLAALARQDHADFKVLISDNASDDGSGAVCESFAAQDHRFVYVRQPVNIGAARNFSYCLDASSSEYFMWCGAHDVISANFLSAMTAALERESGAGLAFGARLAIDEKSAPMESMRGDDRYIYRFSSNRYLRYAQAACALAECTIVYGLFRRRFLEGFVIRPVQSCDKVLLSHALFFGKLTYEFAASYSRRFIGNRSSSQGERILGTRSNEGMDDRSLVDYFASDLDSCFDALDGRLRENWRKKLILAAITARYLRKNRGIRSLAKLQVQPARTLRGWVQGRKGRFRAG